MTILTPRDPAARGTMLTVRLPDAAAVVERLATKGVVVDLRQPDVVRMAPAPLYTRMADVEALADRLEECLHVR